MKKSDVVKIILHNSFSQQVKTATAFAPTNIALCKYWGKRNQELNLPITSSLSISLGDKGASTTLSLAEKNVDTIILNNNAVAEETSFYKKLTNFLDLFRPHPNFYFHVATISTIPIAAGLASSACGFASITLALDKFFAWQLKPYQLSILARLGSGSASRSIDHGFVKWYAGERADGMDSYGRMLDIAWSELCVGLLMVSEKEKSVSSREAMQRTVETSELYKMWPTKVEKDLEVIKQAILDKDFESLGKTAESNALTMHATMLAAWPAIHYSLPETVRMMQTVWQCRHEGIPVYFTQDAGPNLKLLFLEKHAAQVQACFSSLKIVKPFSRTLKTNLTL